MLSDLETESDEMQLLVNVGEYSFLRHFNVFFLTCLIYRVRSDLQTISQTLKIIFGANWNSVNFTESTPQTVECNGFTIA